MGEQLIIGGGPAPLPAMVTCLSLHQPYAGLVAAGLKDETRLFAWPEKSRPYPAPLLICSTLAVSEETVIRAIWHSAARPFSLFADADLWSAARSRLSMFLAAAH